MEKITSRAVIGYILRQLSQDIGVSWVNMISNYFPSDQASEEYAWLGASPAMQEWIGHRQEKGFPEYSFVIKNKDYEATVTIPVRWMNRDKFNMIMIRVQEMVERGQAHWAKLLIDLIILGESEVCYDGQFFFDTDHSEGDSGTQSNDIEVDISTLPVVVHGTTALPSVPELQLAFGQSIAQIMSFLDDVGEPMNETAKEFLFMVPLTYKQAALQAIATPIQVAESQTAMNALQQSLTLHVVTSPRLSDWTTKYACFRTDAAVKSLIRQEETVIDLKAKAEGSDFEFDNKAHSYGIDSSRNVGYGRWQEACLTTLT